MSKRYTFGGLFLREGLGWILVGVTGFPSLVLALRWILWVSPMVAGASLNLGGACEGGHVPGLPLVTLTSHFLSVGALLELCEGTLVTSGMTSSCVGLEQR